jgi:excisionase family DNA binding protein
MQTRTTSRRPRLISAAVAADLLGVSVCTIRRRPHDGTLRPIRFGEKGWMRFDRNELEALISGKPR